jgi:hypothetical protein
MKNLLILAIVALIGWQGYVKYQSSRATAASGHIATDAGARGASRVSTPDATASSQFRCDGRTHCSQMTSCAEATYFLTNCPGTKMDGNNDGVPCEKQWCR